VLVELTQQGIERYQKTVGVQAEKEVLVTSALSGREKAQLNGLLRKMMVEFERREGRADHCD
jgi:hypothetical protein